MVRVAAGGVNRTPGRHAAAAEQSQGRRARSGPRRFAAGPVPVTMSAMNRRPLLLLAACLLAARAAAADVHDAVDPAARFQTIDNFAASDAWTFQAAGTWSPAVKNRIADLLFSTDRGIGLSCWRFNVGGGTQSRSIANPLHAPETFEVAPGRYDWHRQAPEQWFLTAAAARGVDQFVAFANSPPMRMTRTGLTNSAADDRSPTNLKPGYEAPFAAYLADVLAHFRDDGVLDDPAHKITFAYVSPVNEPNNPWPGGKQEGNRADNATIIRVVLALRDALAARHLTAHILAPEAGDAAAMLRPATRPTTRYGQPVGDYIDALTADPALADALGHTLCHHLYGSAAGPALRHAADALAARMKQHPGWKLWMTEICIMEPRRDLGITPGLHLAEIVHATLAREGAAAFGWWTALSAVDFKDGLLYTDWRKPGDPESVLDSKMLWALGNYSRFVRPGDVRVALTGDSAAAQQSHDRRPATRPATRSAAPEGLLGSAYLDPRTGRLVVVYVNDGPAARVELTIPGPPRRRTTYTTSATDSLTPRPAPAGPIDLPARSIVTVVADPR